MLLLDQERVASEKEELDQRIEKLFQFIKSPSMLDVAEAEQSRLRSQLKAMETYSAILGERIAHF
jgi:hypothetical protein